MDPQSLVQAALDFISVHPYVSGGILGVVAVLGYFKLRLVLKLLITGAIIAAVAYVILFIIHLTSSGMESTEKFLDRPGQAIDKIHK